MDYQINRIKICLSKKGVQRQLTNMRLHLQDLQNILGNSDSLTPLRKQPKGRIAVSLQRIRDQACGLYGVFTFGWRCTCSEPHGARLLLEQRPRTNTDQMSRPGLVQFRVVFSIEASNGQPKQHWRETIIETIEKEKKAEHPSKEANDNMKEQHVRSAISSTSRFRSLAKFRSGVDQPKTSHMPPKPPTKIAFQFEKVPEDSVAAIPHKIISLCSIVKDGPREASATSLCCLYDNQGRQYIFNEATGGAHAIESKPIGTISLDHLLRRYPPPPITKSEFSRRDRTRLAVVIASSVLQLHETPWLGSSLSTKDIVFLTEADTKDPLRIRIDTKRPFIVKQFPSQHTSKDLPLQLANVTAQKTSNSALANSEETLLRLGILLLELCFGEALEDQPFRKDYLKPDGTPNRFTGKSASVAFCTCSLCTPYHHI